MVRIQDRVAAPTQAQAVVLTLDQGVELIQVLAVELTPDQVVGLILAPEDPVIQVQVVAVMTNGTALLLTANRI